MTRNNASQQYLVRLQYHRLRISELRFTDNVCAAGCFSTTDSSLSVAASTFADNAAATHIWKSTRSLASLSAITATQFCIESATVRGDAADEAFLSIDDYSSADALLINNTFVASAALAAAVSMTGSSAGFAWHGVHVRVANLSAERIGSAALRFESQPALPYYVAMQVSDSRFSTTALSLQLNAVSAANLSSTLALRHNAFANYSDDSAEPYLVALRTQGAPLHVNLSDNTFANGSIALADAGFYIELAGPLHALMTRQSVDRDSLFVHAVDVAQMTLQHHVFGGNFESRAVFVERSNVSLTPAMALLIAHSRFENAHVDHEMLRLANIQPADAIVLEDNELAGVCQLCVAAPVRQRLCGQQRELTTAPATPPLTRH